MFGDGSALLTSLANFEIRARCFFGQEKRKTRWDCWQTKTSDSLNLTSRKTHH